VMQPNSAGTSLQLGKLYDYDIILLDLAVPDTEGYKLLQQLRAARVRTPILILSGRGELDEKVKFLRFGADDFLTKPRQVFRLLRGLKQDGARPGSSPPPPFGAPSNGSAASGPGSASSGRSAHRRH
jgi:DNA-binding response OmpR family regulator